MHFENTIEAYNGMMMMKKMKEEEAESPSDVRKIGEGSEVGAWGISLWIRSNASPPDSRVWPIGCVSPTSACP